MAKKPVPDSREAQTTGKPSALVDTRVIYCGDNLEQLEQAPRRLRGPDLHRPAVQLQPQLRGLLGRDEGEARLRGPPRLHQPPTSTSCARAASNSPASSRRPAPSTTTATGTPPTTSRSCSTRSSGRTISSTKSSGSGRPRTATRSKAANTIGRLHDTIFFYSGGMRGLHLEPAVRRRYDPELRRIALLAGRRERDDGSSGATYARPAAQRPRKGNPHYEVLGVEGYWRYSQEKMEELIREGRVAIPPRGRSAPLQALSLTNRRDCQLAASGTTSTRSTRRQRSPSAIRRRSRLPCLSESSRPAATTNDIVLDAFCGCGTALVAAQNLGRQWIGIDISPDRLPRHGQAAARRLRHPGGREALADRPRLRRPRPAVDGGAAARDSAVRVRELGRHRPGRHSQQGAGRRHGHRRPHLSPSRPRRRSAARPGELDFMDVWYPIQVKQKDKVGRPDIDAFEAVMTREDRTKGFFVAFDYTQRRPDGDRPFFPKSGQGDRCPDGEGDSGRADRQEAGVRNGGPTTCFRSDAPTPQEHKLVGHWLHPGPQRTGTCPSYRGRAHLDRLSAFVSKRRGA